MSLPDEALLIERAKQGDGEALGTLWDALTPKLFGYLVNTLHDRTAAEDILQTTWLKAIKALPNFQQRVGLSPWLFAIAKNECRDQWRKGGRETPLDPLIHDKAQSNQHELEDSFLVEKILGTLSELDREILRLRYIADLSVDDIAKTLKMNPVTARVRIHRALARARVSLNSINS